MDCNNPMSAVYCSAQPDQLYVMPKIYYEITTLSPNPCCLQNCVLHAEYNGSNCVCSANYYSNGSGCTACNSGYSAPVGSTSPADCTKTCAGTISHCSTYDNSTVSQPDTCACDTCSNGYYGANCTTCGTCNITNGTATVTTTSSNNCSYAVACNQGYSMSSNTCTTNSGGTANCTANTYNVVLDKNGGSGPDGSVTATYNSAMPTIAANDLPTRANYVFDGYYSASTGGTQYYTPGGTSAHVWDIVGTGTLYAHWTLCVPGTGTNGTVQMTVSGNSCKFYITCNTGYQSDYYDANHTSSNSSLTCTTCSPGYYCPGGVRQKCSVGKTSSAGSDASNDCRIKGGSTGTKFCDSRGCFTLPTGVNIMY